MVKCTVGRDSRRKHRILNVTFRNVGNRPQSLRYSSEQQGGNNGERSILKTVNQTAKRRRRGGSLDTSISIVAIDCNEWPKNKPKFDGKINDDKQRLWLSVIHHLFHVAITSLSASRLCDHGANGHLGFGRTTIPIARQIGFRNKANDDDDDQAMPSFPASKKPPSSNITSTSTSTSSSSPSTHTDLIQITSQCSGENGPPGLSLSFRIGNQDDEGAGMLRSARCLRKGRAAKINIWWGIWNRCVYVFLFSFLSFIWMSWLQAECIPAVTRCIGVWRLKSSSIPLLIEWNPTVHQCTPTNESTWRECQVPHSPSRTIDSRACAITPAATSTSIISPPLCRRTSLFTDSILEGPLDSLYQPCTPPANYLPGQCQTAMFHLRAVRKRARHHARWWWLPDKGDIRTCTCRWPGVLATAALSWFIVLRLYIPRFIMYLCRGDAAYHTGRKAQRRTEERGTMTPVTMDGAVEHDAILITSASTAMPFYDAAFRSSILQPWAPIQHPRPSPCHFTTQPYIPCHLHSLDWLHYFVVSAFFLAAFV